ncbi:MAG TPA: PEP-CTERM sorting domain-containing protein [Pyrinomonadaceae bacterium]
MLKSTISRVAVSAFAVIVLCQVAKADPVVPVGTVLGGTIIASSSIQAALSGSLQTLDQNGNPFLITFSSQGSMLNFIGGPGTPVVFQAVIAGTADQGNVAMQMIFQGTGPVIPQTNAPTLDLVGFGTIDFSGFTCTGGCLVGTPLFSFSGTFSGPVALHFTSFDFNGETRYLLRTATLSTSNVPEPVSMLLLATGLAASSIVIRCKRGK